MCHGAVVKAGFDAIPAARAPLRLQAHPGVPDRHAVRPQIINVNGRTWRCACTVRTQAKSRQCGIKPGIGIGGFIIFKLAAGPQFSGPRQFFTLALAASQQHLAWHGLTLPADHPFWKSHWAPNGFGCQCRITSVTRKEGEASERAGLGEPPAGWDAIDPATGEQVGIGKGFGYTPGANVNVPLRQMVQDKLITYPPAIAKALAADIGRYINTTEAATEFAKRTLVDPSVTEPLFVGFVENDAVVSQATGLDVKGYFVTIPGDVPRHAQTSHGYDGRGQRPAMPPDYERVRSVLNEADSIRAGNLSRNGNATVVASKKIGLEIYRAVFEVLAGKRNRALALLSLVIKTPQ